MNNEEAIEYLKNYKYDNEVKQAIDTVLDYIADLEKENAVKESNFKIVSAYNEELEKKLETQTQNYHSAMEDVNYFCGNFIPKQKIRDKIEELEKYRKDYEEEYSIDLDLDYMYDMNAMNRKIDILKELLEVQDG